MYEAYDRSYLPQEADEQMEQSQYHHFSSSARDGVEAVVVPTGDRDHIGCFADQVELTRALVWDLDEAIKEAKLLGELEEESSQNITELEALCKRSREDAQKLKKIWDSSMRCSRLAITPVDCLWSYGAVPLIYYWEFST
jgi:hypothetical protein